MKKLSFFILISLAALSISSCKKIIDIHLNEPKNVLIIDAQLNPDSALNKVYVRHTSLTKNDSNAIVKDAKVELINLKNDSIFTLNYTNQGYYLLSDSISMRDAQYRLSITHNNTTYSATSAVYPKISDFKASLNKIGQFSNTRTLLLTVAIKDPEPNAFNYYRITVDNTESDKNYYLSNDSHKVPGSNLIKDDIFIRLNQSDTTLFEVQAISEAAYRFISDLNLLDPSQSFSLGEKTGNPTSMFDNGAIGIFIIGQGTSYSNK